MRIVNLFWIFVQLGCFSCVSFQALTLDDQFHESPPTLEKESKSPPMQALFGNNKKREKRKIIMDQSAMLNIGNWYPCNSKNTQIMGDNSGVKIVFDQALNDCFGISFPATDVSAHPFIKMNAGIKDYSNTDLFDLKLMLVDQDQHQSILVNSKYLIHDGKLHTCYLDLSDLHLKNPNLKLNAITQILFFANTIQSAPVSGSLIISHIEFVRSEQ